MNSIRLVKNLEDIVNKGLKGNVMPVVTGQRICFNNFVVSPSSTTTGYTVTNIKTKSTVAITYFKSTGIAIAKSLATGKDVTRKMLAYDSALSKHYNDSIYFKHTIKETDDVRIKEIRIVRLEISIAQTKNIRKEIDKYIY